MARVLYAVSPIGLGHAARALAVARELRVAGAQILFASGGSAAGFIRGSGFDVEDVVAPAAPSVRGGVMRQASGWYLRYWLAYRQSKGAVARLLDRYDPDIVVGDEEFASVTLAMQRGVRHALFTDETQLGFARTAIAKRIESRVSAWYGRLLADVMAVLVPDFGEDSGNVHHTGPVVRRVTKSRDEVMKQHSLPPDVPLVLLSLSGSGAGLELVEPTLRALGEVGRATLAVSGEAGWDGASPGVRYLGQVLDNQNLVAAADLVVSTAGKSTIDEAASAGTPIIAVPIRNHAEQERNAAALGYGPGDESRLGELVRDRIGRREAPREYRGAEKASRLLLAML